MLLMLSSNRSFSFQNFVGSHVNVNVKFHDILMFYFNVQVFPDGAADTADNHSDVISSFPSFRKPAIKLGTLSFQGSQGGMDTAAGTWGGDVVNKAGDMCRITGAGTQFTLTASSGGYNSYTPADGSKPRNYEEDAGHYCGCTKGHTPCDGNSKHSKTVYKGSLSVQECQAKCDDLNCVCFDHNGGGGGGGSGSIGTGVAGSGPVVFFQKDLKTSVVVSAFSNMMAHSQGKDTDDALHYGILGHTTAVPKGYSISTVVVLSSGVNKAMDALGDLLLQQSGKERYAYRRDLAMQYLGYSTDNGYTYK
jgi:hypothetical protein